MSDLNDENYRYRKIYVTKDRSTRVKKLVEFVAKKAGDDEFGDVGSVRTPARGTHG